MHHAIWHYSVAARTDKEITLKVPVPGILQMVRRCTGGSEGNLDAYVEVDPLEDGKHMTELKLTFKGPGHTFDPDRYMYFDTVDCVDGDVLHVFEGLR